MWSKGEDWSHKMICETDRKLDGQEYGQNVEVSGHRKMLRYPDTGWVPVAISNE
jgi:hypothetical protein